MGTFVTLTLVQPTAADAALLVFSPLLYLLLAASQLDTPPITADSRQPVTLATNLIVLALVLVFGRLTPVRPRSIASSPPGSLIQSQNPQHKARSHLT